MTQVYEKLETERFKTRFVDGHDQIEIPSGRNWFVIPFLTFWLCMWTIGGILAITSLFSDFRFFIMFWLCGWAVGWIFAAATISWQLTGKEVIRTVGQDLEVGYQMLGFTRMKLYRGADIRNLNVEAAGNLMRHFQISIPFYHGANFGTLKFDYGLKTLRFGSGVEEAEGRSIIAKLSSKLPLSAVTP